MRGGPGSRVVVAEHRLRPRVRIPGIRQPPREHGSAARPPPTSGAVVTVAGVRVRVMVVVHVLAALVRVDAQAGRRATIETMAAAGSTAGS